MISAALRALKVAVWMCRMTLGKSLLRDQNDGQLLAKIGKPSERCQLRLVGENAIKCAACQAHAIGKWLRRLGH